jgi:hypothetical protein
MCIGYLGDKIGYNTVLVVNLLGCALAQTALDWTPRFYEHHRVPTLSVLQNETFQADEIVQFVWPLQCNTTNVTIEDCKINAEGQKLLLLLTMLSVLKLSFFSEKLIICEMMTLFIQNGYRDREQNILTFSVKTRVNQN